MTAEGTGSVMTLAEIQRVLDADVLCGAESLGMRIPVAYASDLMSDVLTMARSGALLLTGLTNSQVVRTAEMAEIGAVCFVRGKQPPAETMALAKEKGIPLLATKLLMYECCGHLHEEGLAGGTYCE